jgi:uncharacterized protein (TIGR03435 family)
MIRQAVVLAVGVGSVAVLSAQSTEAVLAFDVASVRQNPEPGFLRFSILPGGRLIVQGHTLATIIRHAFNVSEVHISAMPPWATVERYDITATARSGVDTSSRAVMAMLRNLLVTRFALKWDVETREMPIYTLAFSRNDRRLGAGLRQSDNDCSAFVPGRSEAPEATAGPGCAITFSGTRFQLRGRSLPQLASDLQVFTDRPVIDGTGLGGRYDVELSFTYQPKGSPVVDEPNGVSLFTAVQEQLGLKLEPARGPVEVLVIESVERPTPD